MGDLDIATKLGQHARILRLGLGLSQDKFADKIDMHRAYYGSFERGDRNSTLPTLNRIAIGLGTSPSAMLAAIGF